MDMFTLLNIKWIIDKDLLCSTGNSILSNDLYGKRILKRVDICICVTVHFAVE